jgi:DNA-binding NtrC family response regulator
VLERRTFRRLGGEEERPADVRVIAATHRDLSAEVNAGRFRADLFYRVAVVVLHVPPLRERREDIPRLVEAFLSELEVPGAEELLASDAVARRLSAHAFRGNVRELRNFVRATVALGEPAPLREGGATADALHAKLVANLDAPFREAKQRVVEEFERRYLEHLLARSGGNVRGAAREAGMNRSYLIELLDRYGLRGAG